MISGMSCASCTGAVSKITERIDGVQGVEVHFSTHTLLVKWSSETVAIHNYPQLYDTLKKQGYIIKPLLGKSNSLPEKYGVRLLFSALCLFAALAITRLYPSISHRDYIILGLTLTAMLGSGRSFYALAYKRLKHGRSDMNTLIALSTLVSFAYSAINVFRGDREQIYFDAVLFIIFFTLLGKYFEQRLQRKAFRSISTLFDFFPKHVLVIDETAKEKKKKLSEVKIGERVKVRAGEKVPVDGIILKGSAFLDENLITGETTNTPKEVGDRVYMGTMNQEGVLEVRVQKLGADTMLHQIISSMEKVEVRLVALQPAIDRWVSIFVPVVLALALLTLIITGFAFGDFSQGVLNLVNVLVISCPCALGLGPSLAVMRGVRNASKLGIYVKNVAVFDKIRKLSTVVMDKTGTLTLGEPKLTDIYMCDGQTFTEEEVLALRTLEGNTMHPLAGAIDNYLSKTFPIPESQTSETPMLEEYRLFSGKGISGVVAGEVYLVGNARLMEEKGCELHNDISKKAMDFELEGKTLVYFSKNAKVRGLMAFQDPIRSMSKKLVSMMRKKYGIESHMLTGDHAVSAHWVADRVGIKKVMSQALPTHKAEYITNLQSEQNLVAMIGDGINDAPALAQADVGISMNSQVDIANEMSDVSIVKPGIASVLHFFGIADRTQKTIRQNLVFTFLYNILSLPIAAGLFTSWGLSLTPSIASFAMFASSLSVVLNSLGGVYKPKT